MSLPAAFLERLNNILPKGVSHDFGPKTQVSFRVNTLKAHLSEVEDYLKTVNIAFKTISWYSNAFCVSSADARVILDSALATEGKVYSQGLESMLPVIILDPQPGETILDMCAAPGSKTSQIAAHMKNEGLLWANEPVQKRFYRLKSVTELMGAKVKLSMSDGRYMRQEGIFDRILIDAPCSSEGRFVVDEPKSFGYWSPRKINEMQHKQKGLLLNAARLLKPGGVMVYSTCTFAPEENEAVLDWFLRKNKEDVVLADINIQDVARYQPLSEWNGKSFDPSVLKSMRILPGNGVEGFFVAKLIRS